MKREDDMVCVFFKSSPGTLIKMNDTVVIDSINYSTEAMKYVTLDHKSSLQCQFIEILIYTSSEKLNK